MRPKESRRIWLPKKYLGVLKGPSEWIYFNILFDSSSFFTHFIKASSHSILSFITVYPSSFYKFLTVLANSFHEFLSISCLLSLCSSPVRSLFHRSSIGFNMAQVIHTVAAAVAAAVLSDIFPTYFNRKAFIFSINHVNKNKKLMFTGLK